MGVNAVDDGAQKSDIPENAGSSNIKTDLGHDNLESTSPATFNSLPITTDQSESAKLDSGLSNGKSESQKVTEIAATKRDLKDTQPVDDEEERIVKELLNTKTEPGIEDASLRSLENDINSLDLSKKSDIEDLSRIIRNKMHTSRMMKRND